MIRGCLYFSVFNLDCLNSYSQMICELCQKIQEKKKNSSRIIAWETYETQECKVNPTKKSKWIKRADKLRRKL